ncbi:hypothetical protein VR45_28555 [Streptomyces sp. NRRL S-495]|nr:hypothetical protein VR45_28555 [Streptomyces sp. NRRL S-495]
MQRRLRGGRPGHAPAAGPVLCVVRMPRMVLVLFMVHVLPMLLVLPMARIVPVVPVAVVPMVAVVVVTAVLPLVLGGVRHVVLHVLDPSPCCPARR